MQELISRLAATGFNVSPTLTNDYIRFDRTKPLSGYFKCWEIKSPHGEVLEVRAKWGDWAAGEKYNWAGGIATSNMTAEELAAHRSAMEEALAAQEAEKAAAAAAAALEARDIYSRATSVSYHPYLKRKGILGRSPARIFEDKLCIPVFIDGQISSLQMIDAEGRKRFLTNGRINAGYSWIAAELPITPPTKVYVCEGYATAASVFEALNEFTLVAFNAGNLPKLAASYQWGTAEIIVCADNDYATPGNPGLTYARKAVEILRGQGLRASMIYPEFEPALLEKKLSDWNDYHQTYGLDALRKVLQAAPMIETPMNLPANTQNDAPLLTPSPEALSPIESKQAKAKKEKEPAKKSFEKIAAEWLLADQSKRLVRQDKALLWYDGRRWVEADSTFVDSVKNKISGYCGDTIDSKKVNSAYATFFRYVPSVPKGVNLFVPNATCTNFLDGTLHLRRDLKTNTYTTEFLPHRPEDWLMWVIPVNYEVDRGKRNTLFDALLTEAFRGDADGMAKIESLQEMAGAMLVPAFPQFFFLTGVSGSRKSTIAKSLLKIFQAGGYENVSFVDPSQMENFQIEGMIGKLVNTNLDIDDETPLKRGFLKRFEDGLPFQVNRKGKVVVNSVLPGVHVYACNHLPPNAEKSRALARRISLIEFHNDLTNDNRESEVKFYEDIVYASGPEGLLNFALDGLARLLQNGGKFRPPPSSQKRLNKWMDEGSPVAMFLEAAANGEVGPKGAEIYLQENQKIARSQLGEIYAKWRGSAPKQCVNSMLGRFYTELERRGFKQSKVEGVRYFSGIGVKGALTGGQGF